MNCVFVLVLMVILANLRLILPWPIVCLPNFVTSVSFDPLFAFCVEAAPARFFRLFNAAIFPPLVTVELVTALESTALVSTVSVLDPTSDA